MFLVNCQSRILPVLHCHFPMAKGGAKNVFPWKPGRSLLHELIHFRSPLSSASFVRELSIYDKSSTECSVDCTRDEPSIKVTLKVSFSCFQSFFPPYIPAYSVSRIKLEINENTLISWGELVPNFT